MGQLSLNDALGENKASLSFVQELPSTDADPYFFPRAVAVMDNHGDEITAPLAFGPKLIYHVDHVSDMYCQYILTSVALEIIAVAHDEGHPGFVQYYKIVSCS